MQAVTLTIAAIASAFVLSLRPAKALAVYFILLLAYPTFLVVQLGTLDISAARIVGGVLLMRCLFDARISKKVKWCALDKWVVFMAVVTVGVPLLTWKMPGMRVLENRSGYMMDTFLAYVVARFCIDDYRALKLTAKWVAPVLVLLALLGVVESLYGIQPFFALRRFCPWRPGGTYLTTNPRLGYFRAVGPAGHPILFGAAFVMFMPIVWALRHEPRPWKTWAYLVVAFASLGAMCSMSSAPWMMMLMLWGCLWLERFKGLVKPLLAFGISSVFIVDIISNRTFYHVLASYANPIGGTGWHRAKLIDLAIEHFGEWWLTGYGGEDPGWGARLGMTWTDITSDYIFAGVSYGVWGVIGLVGILASVTILLARAHHRTKDPIFRSWCWALGSLIVVLTISFSSCTFFDQSRTYFYAMLAIAASIVQAQQRLEDATKVQVQRVRVAQPAPPAPDQVVAGK